MVRFLLKRSLREILSKTFTRRPVAMDLRAIKRSFMKGHSEGDFAASGAVRGRVFSASGRSRSVCRDVRR